MSGIDLDPPATSIGEVDIHLRYMRQEVSKLVQALPQMATKADIAELSRKFESYATHDDVRALRTDVEYLREQVEAGSVPGSLSRWLGWVTKVGSAAAVLAAFGAAVAAAVHFIDRVPK